MVTREGRIEAKMNYVAMITVFSLLVDILVIQTNAVVSEREAIKGATRFELNHLFLRMTS